MANEGQFPIKITGDASSLVSAAKSADEALAEMRAGIRRVTDDSERYQQALQEMAENSRKATAAIRAKAVAVAESENAQKALELSRINLQEAQGRLTGPQAIVARAGVEEKYAQKKVGEAKEAREAELQVKRKELEGLRLEA